MAIRPETKGLAPSAEPATLAASNMAQTEAGLATDPHPLARLAVIAIGRNEGPRLRRALAALQGQGCPVIYVDSGSTDDSLDIARDSGAIIVELDMSTPFSAARARNAGAEAALALTPRPEVLQFIDGDCAVVDGWLDKGLAYLEAHPDCWLVTGWRRELHRDASVYNALADVEWFRPAGEIADCAGDVMVPVTAFETVGGFDPTAIAGEDIDFCLRLSKAGGKLVRLPENMTRHDLDMTRFSAWWRRTVRSGHSFAHVEHLHPGHARRDLARAWVYGGALPLLALAAAIWAPWGLALIAAAYAANYLRTARGLIRNGQPGREALHHALLLLLAKFANLIGILIFHSRRLRRRDMVLIEYK